MTRSIAFALAALLFGCGSSNDGPSTGSADSAIDSTISEATPDASADNTREDSATTGEDSASADALDTSSADTLLSTDAGADSASDVPPWLATDGSWDAAPPWDTWVDDAGCAKIWRHSTTTPPAYSYGSDGLTFTGGETISQAYLVGDFDITLTVTSLGTLSGGLVANVQISVGDEAAWSGGKVGSAFAHLRVGRVWTSVTPPGVSGVQDYVPSSATSATLHIRRVGTSLTVDAVGGDGTSAHSASDVFSAGPLRIDLAGASSALVMRSFAVTGGGGDVKSDDFHCDGIFVP